ncbi:hypothetical protein LCGC14_0499320 [marine sediment metagenome]|uniref:Uncharacterized protein n=1 Tax=marine sediment metagenome TaxID=412755 RepID=A0A0F9SMU0_9ZZZZ
MPLYHVNVSVVVGDQHLTFSKVVEAKGSVAGPIKLTVARLPGVYQREEAPSDIGSSSRCYAGHASDLTLIHGEVPEPEPITDRRGAIRDQKARNG